MYLQTIIAVHWCAMLMKRHSQLGCAKCFICDTRVCFNTLSHWREGSESKKGGNVLTGITYNFRLWKYFVPAGKLNQPLTSSASGHSGDHYLRPWKAVNDVASDPFDDSLSEIICCYLDTWII